MSSICTIRAVPPGGWCFRLNALVAGGLHPRGFHVINILLHGVVSVVFLRVFSVLLGGAQSSRGAEIGFAAPRASFLCGVLFAVHPIHTEAVSGAFIIYFLIVIEFVLKVLRPLNFLPVSF